LAEDPSKDCRGVATRVYLPTLICGAAPHWNSAAEKTGIGIFPHWLTDEHLVVLRSDKQECRLADDIGCLLLDKRNVCRERKGFVVKLRAGESNCRDRHDVEKAEVL